MSEPVDQTPPPAEPAPTWQPPRARDPARPSIIAGVILLVIGIWFLFDQTLGFDMPRIRWADIWPIILIAIGALMLLRSAGRRA
jgi:hypothetical protein